MSHVLIAILTKIGKSDKSTNGVAEPFSLISRLLIFKFDKLSLGFFTYNLNVPKLSPIFKFSTLKENKALFDRLSSLKSTTIVKGDEKLSLIDDKSTFNLIVFSTG